jgi:hypothetical protein
MGLFWKKIWGLKFSKYGVILFEMVEQDIKSKETERYIKPTAEFWHRLDTLAEKRGIPVPDLVNNIICTGLAVAEEEDGGGRVMVITPHKHLREIKIFSNHQKPSA